MNPTTKARWIIAAIVVVGLLIIGALAGPDDDADSTADLPTTTPVTTEAPALGSTGPVTADTTTTTGVPPSSSVPPTTVPVTTAAPTTAAPAGPVATARWILSGIPIRGRAPKTGYERARFGPAWTDNVAVAGGHNGCDTRNDILRRDLRDLTVRPGTRNCIILTGVLSDPYTGRRIDFVRGSRTSTAVQIDHVVALNDAWQKGAQKIGAERRRELANDPMNLLAVDGPTNQSKGAGDAATWLPPNKAFRCRYVALQTWVKARYDLWMTGAEHDAIERILSRCTDPQVGTID